MPDFENKGAHGAAYWVDILGPAVSINPPGLESDMGRDPTTGWLTAAHHATQLVFVQYQFPHGFVEGSTGTFSPHVHWHKSTSASGTVAWRLRYKYANPGWTWTDWSSPIEVTTPSVSDADTAGRQAITSFGLLTIPNAKISCNVLCEVARVGANGTYAASVFVTDIDAHVLVNQPGSVTPFQKYQGSLQLT